MNNAAKTVATQHTAISIKSIRASRCVRPSPEVVTLIAKSYFPILLRSVVVTFVVVGFVAPSAVTKRVRLFIEPLPREGRMGEEIEGFLIMLADDVEKIICGAMDEGVAEEECTEED